MPLRVPKDPAGNQRPEGTSEAVRATWARSACLDVFARAGEQVERQGVKDRSQEPGELLPHRPDRARGFMHTLRELAGMPGTDRLLAQANHQGHGTLESG